MISLSRLLVLLPRILRLEIGLTFLGLNRLSLTIQKNGVEPIVWVVGLTESANSWFPEVFVGIQRIRLLGLDKWKTRATLNSVLTTIA